MVVIRFSRSDESARLIEIWREAVDATHDFLRAEDRITIDRLVCDFLPTLPLCVAVDHGDRPIGFMLLQGGHMEALFVDPSIHGGGVGSTLVRHALALHPSLTTNVNEQNARAIGFYERMGFRRIGRSPVDEQGMPYPLIHLAYP